MSRVQDSMKVKRALQCFSRNSSFLFAVLIALLFLFAVISILWRFPVRKRIRVISTKEFSESDEELTQRSPMYVAHKLRSYILRLHANCSRSVRLGNVKDGGWNFCINANFMPTLGRPCLVYSFGINFDFSFDDDVVEYFGCTVRSFDPSLGVANHMRGNNIHFYQIGLGGRNEEKNHLGWSIRTFTWLLKEFGEQQKTIDMLKIDIEGDEWASLDEMIESNSLVNVKQLAFEIHLHHDNHSVRDASKLLKQWRTLANLEQAGFKRWSSRPNSLAAKLHAHNKLYAIDFFEVVYLNSRF